MHLLCLIIGYINVQYIIILLRYFAGNCEFKPNIIVSIIHVHNFICSVDWNPKIGVWIGATPHRLSKHDLDQFMDMTPAERSSFFRWTDGSKLNYSSKYMQ